MLLIDTSAWITFFNDAESPAASFIETALLGNVAVCINAVIEMEILQGIRDERSYAATKEYLQDFQYFPDFKKSYFDKAAEIYRTCRTSGITIRRSLDCLIAANGLLDGLEIVHQDRDFEQIKRVFPSLMTTPIRSLP